jgi:hypothetical protein
MTYYQVHIFGVDVPNLDLPHDYFDGRDVLTNLPRHVTGHGSATATYLVDPAPQ